MKCLYPKKIPAGRAAEGARKEVGCRQCHPCRTNLRNQAADRVEWEFGGLELPRLLTVTYADEYLPMSPAIPAGVLTPKQEKLMGALQKRSQCFGPSTQAHDVRKRDIMLAENPSRPTVCPAHVRAWAELCRKGIPGLVMLPVDEYGTRFGRPHAHALVGRVGTYLTEDEVSWMLARWRYGLTHSLYADSPRALRYVAKDIQKGSWQREYFVAEGREPPRVHWPRKPYIGASQEDEIYRAVKAVSVTGCPFTLSLQIRQGLGKWFCRHTAKGRSYRRFGDTAYKNAIKRLVAEGVIDAVSEENAMTVMDYVANDKLAEVTPGHDQFKQEMYDRHQESKASAVAASKAAIWRHERILRGKKRPGDIGVFPSG